MKNLFIVLFLMVVGIATASTASAQFVYSGPVVQVEVGPVAPVFYPRARGLYVHPSYNARYYDATPLPTPHVYYYGPVRRYYLYR